MKRQRLAFSLKSDRSRPTETDADRAVHGWLAAQSLASVPPQLALAENAYPNLGKQAWEIGMAVHESNRQLAYAVEEAMEAMIRDGRLKAMYAAYGLRYEVPEMYQ